MKKNWIFGASIAGAVIVVSGCLLWFSYPATTGGVKQNPPGPTAKTKPPVNTAQSQANQAALSAATPEEKRQAAEAIFKILSHGSEEIHPASKYLQKAIDTKDQSQILQALSRLYWSGLWKMSEVIPTLKEFLNNPDPFVRYHVAETLFKVGDQSGYSTLLALVQSPNPIPEDGDDDSPNGGGDMRIDAARTLAQYGQTDATQAIYNLYQQTKSGDLRVALLTLNPTEVSTLIPSTGYNQATPGLYGLENDRQYLPQLTSTFNNTQNPQLKAAAAWSLATLTGDENAINYLVQEAQTGLSDPSAVDDLTERNIIKYLGTIQTPAAKQTLEAALSSSDATIVQTAIVNLIYNQGGSDKAVQVIANQLTDTAHATLPWDFTLNVAAQLTSNPTIQSAGQTFAQHDAIGNWQLYTVERANWPVNNWIGGYVVKLNKSH